MIVDLVLSDIVVYDTIDKIVELLLEKAHIIRYVITKDLRNK